MTLDQYIDSLRGSRVTVVGIGVSNRPLLRLLLDHGVDVIARDKRTREKLGEEEAASLEAQGCRLRLGEEYLSDLTEDVIFRTPGLHPFTPELAAAKARGAVLSPSVEAATTDQILPMVAHNIGLGFVPEAFAAEAIRKGIVFRIRLDEELPSRQICIVRDKRRPLSMPALALCRMLS